ncbi:NAD(P)/FAD-dependent oxidoreductase [Nocardioides sp. GXZ039]|uniref:NAD(P)/FAD-dependent oxidoreductase n=1 Tax=Nocardioides sp. GXZ039 TaxID=3136018 RepID=UPI0030F45D80
MSASPRSVLVVGASLAGVETVRALRTEGFDGAITVLGEEPHAPYDRPPLSKGFLDGTLGLEQVALDMPVDGVVLRTGTRAVRLVPETREVLTSAGERLRADAVVVATGARARRLDSPFGPEQGVHVLRSLRDAHALRADLVAGSRLVVVGGGFIGTEVAATAAGLGLDVTIVETQPVLLEQQLGPLLSGVLTVHHERHGVGIVTGSAVGELQGSTRVSGVRLLDGRVLPADVVLVGVGSRPNVEWLADSGLPVADGVLCDDSGLVRAGVVAVGDCSAWRDADGAHRRRQHWTAALRQAGVAARTLLGLPSSEQSVDLDYVWSDQYGLRLQVLGRPAAHLRCEVAGDPSGESFTATFHDDEAGGVIRAVASVSDPRGFGRARRSVGKVPSTA